MNCFYWHKQRTTTTTICRTDRSLMMTTTGFWTHLLCLALGESAALTKFHASPSVLNFLYLAPLKPFTCSSHLGLQIQKFSQRTGKVYTRYPRFSLKKKNYFNYISCNTSKKNASIYSEFSQGFSVFSYLAVLLYCSQESRV